MEATKVFDKLDELNTAIVMKDNKIQQLNYEFFLAELRSKSTPINTRPFLDFMSTLKGKNKSSGKNGISRLQTFLNAYIEESALKHLNPSLRFVNDDHDCLVRYGHGVEAPEFIFTSSSGVEYTIEAKMYWDESSFRRNLPGTNFHNADYVCLFFLKDPKYRWAFAKKEDNYEKIYKIIELAESDPHLLELKLPQRLTTISFNIRPDATDEDVPESVFYRFYTN